MLHTEIDADGIATLTIDMPGRPMNVIDWELGRLLGEAFTGLAADAAVKGIILTSGKSSFVAGADLAIIGDMRGPGTSPASAARSIRAVADNFRRIETCGKPVVAAAPGTALGGGMELMLACHHRIAAANPKARFGFPEVTLGLLPAGGGTQRLPRMIGLAAALPLLVKGKVLTDEEALKAGLLDALVPAEALLGAAKAALLEGRVSATAPWDLKGFRLPGDAPNSPAALELFTLWNARTLAETKGNYPAPRAVLSAVFEGSRLPIDAGLKVEQDLFGPLANGEVSQALIGTMFFSRQACDKAGRKAGDPEAASVRAGREAFIAEGLALAAEGAAPVLIDNAALALGFRKGPIALAREAGRDISAAASPETPLQGAPDYEAVKLRLMRAPTAALERHLALADTDARTFADLDAVLGWGFPAWTGGPLAWAARQGRDR